MATLLFVQLHLPLTCSWNPCLSQEVALRTTSRSKVGANHLEAGWTQRLHSGTPTPCLSVRGPRSTLKQSNWGKNKISRLQGLKWNRDWGGGLMVVDHGTPWPVGPNDHKLQTAVT